MGSLKAFVDTNVIIRHLEGEINLSEIRSRFKLYSNAVVFSEVFMVYIKALTGKKSYELKRNPELIIERKGELEELFLLFEIFEGLEINKEVRNLAFEIMKRYGLLPNDALILATCKFYGVKHLISFDTDFRESCKKEGIELMEIPKKT